MAQWLATTFPNLYGSGAGSHSLVNSNGTYFTNSQVASAYAKFTGGDQQVLSAALSVYATSTNLAGTNVHSTDSHFNTSPAGSGMDTYNVGVNGAAFGLANNTTLTVMQLLVDLNAGTTAGAAVASGANAVFSGINTIGNITNASLADVGLAYTPAQIRTAYGINNLALDGTGQTIAIVDAYDDPAIFQSLDTYDNQFGLTVLRSDALPAVRPGVVVPAQCSIRTARRVPCPRRTRVGPAAATGKSRKRWTWNGCMPWRQGPRSSSWKPTASRSPT